MKLAQSLGTIICTLSILVALHDNEQQEVVPIEKEEVTVTDAVVLPDSVQEEQGSPVASFDPAAYVYEVRVRGYDVRTGQAIFAGGSAVATSNGLYTCQHLTEGLRARFAVDVKVNGEWRLNVPYRVLGDGTKVDLAQITGVDVSGVVVRQPEYKQRVIVHGIKSGRSEGDITGNSESGWTVALDVESQGIRQGDSGGGVFSTDGGLLGIVRAHQAKPANNRVVYFSPAPPQVMSSGEVGLNGSFGSISEFMQAGKPNRVVVFTADWCVPCQQYKAAYQPLSSSEQFDSDIQVIDADRYPELMRLFGVRSLPSTYSGGFLYIGNQSELWLRQQIGYSSNGKQQAHQVSPKRRGLFGLVK